jgi:hypothetical protein
MSWRDFKASYRSDTEDWAAARKELEEVAHPVVFWCWDAYEPGPPDPLLGKWPLEVCDQQETERLGLPTIDVFLYSDPNPRLYTDLRRCYGSERNADLRGMRDLFRDRHVVVSLEEMIPLVLDDGRGLDLDARALQESVTWATPAEHAKFLFVYLRIETTYEDSHSQDESHAVLYTPLPPHRVVEILFPAIVPVPGYVLDAARSNWRGAPGPAGFETMGGWLDAQRSLLLFAPDNVAAGWVRRTPDFLWSARPDEESGRPHLYKHQ